MKCCRYRTVFALVFGLCLFIAPASATPATVVPDLAAIEKASLVLANEARREFHPDADSPIVSTQFLGINRERFLLPQAETVYTVHLAEETEWYKNSLQYLLVLRVDGDALEPLLVYCGGLNLNGFTVRTVNLGGGGERRDVLYIEDNSSGTGTTEQHLLLFRYDEALGCLVNILAQNITFLSSASKPFSIFESAVEFRQGAGLWKDVVVRTRWYARPESLDAPDSDRAEVKQTESVFSWDGKVYSGAFVVPDGAGGDLVFPLRCPGRWGQPVADTP